MGCFGSLLLFDFCSRSIFELDINLVQALLCTSFNFSLALCSFRCKNLHISAVIRNRG